MSGFLVKDYETRSEANLKKCGAWEYSKHPSTRILCAAYRFASTREGLATARTKWWSPFLNQQFPHELLEHLENPAVIKVARNAGFEQAITANVLPRYVEGLRPIPPEEWLCTAALAATHALPRSLEGTSSVLKLPHQKDKEGHRLMLKMAKPRKATKNNTRKWHCKRADLDRLIKYCVSDVDADVDCFLALPPLTREEREIWCLDQKINQRGFRIDRVLVRAALKVREEVMRDFTTELRTITHDRIGTPNQTAVILKWLKSHGHPLPNLQAKTVADAIKMLAGGRVKRVLEIRSHASKTSTKKWAALELRTRSDGWLRDILVYHAASTGRWGGAGFQPQNLPRGTFKDANKDAEKKHPLILTITDHLKTGNTEMLRLLYGEPMNVLSAALRCAIIAPEGCEFFCGDYAAIEARKLFWLAEHEKGIKAFHNNEPMYELMAQIIYNVKHLKDVTDAQRWVGKQTVLGCGYGMGWKKFISQCEKYGVTVTPEVAKKAINAYRKHHHHVPRYWRKLEACAIAAVQNPGKRYTTNKTTWYVKGLFLYCVLPSGRRLAYYGPQVKMGRTPWGTRVPQLWHWGIDSKTKKWVFRKTWGGTLSENVCQAVSRDFMAAAMLRIEKAGYRIALSVHDELLTWRRKGEGTVAEFIRLMTLRPAWAAGAPVKVEAWAGNRYRK